MSLFIFVQVYRVSCVDTTAGTVKRKQVTFVYHIPYNIIGLNTID